MTTLQTRLYWREWGRARERFLGLGFTNAQADAKRHELHLKALGKAKSSKALNNADLDKVLAAFRAVWDDANLDAQLRQEEQPEKRRIALQQRCYRAVESFITDPIEARRSLAIENYVGATAQRICHKRFDELGEAELGKVAGALERSARVRAGHRNAEQEAERMMAADKEPF
jgi:hypothetical protein